MGAPVLAASGHAIPAIPAIPAASHDDDVSPPHIVQRRTRGNRMLWYCLKVIQQPERARACGSGPKCKCIALHVVARLTNMSRSVC
jgi:hypothetical protein